MKIQTFDEIKRTLNELTDLCEKKKDKELLIYCQELETLFNQYTSEVFDLVLGKTI